MQGPSCADLTAFSGDNFCKFVVHGDALSDHVDKLRLSGVHAFLFPALLYTTFVMASFSRCYIDCCVMVYSEKALKPVQT
jgi:hypothetical protein